MCKCVLVYFDVSVGTNKHEMLHSRICNDEASQIQTGGIDSLPIIQKQNRRYMGRTQCYRANAAYSLCGVKSGSTAPSNPCSETHCSHPRYSQENAVAVASKHVKSLLKNSHSAVLPSVSSTTGTFTCVANKLLYLLRTFR